MQNNISMLAVVILCHTKDLFLPCEASALFQQVQKVSFCRCSHSTTSFAGRQHSHRQSSMVDHGLQARPRGCTQMRDMSH
jgi:hypothetical protein